MHEFSTMAMTVESVLEELKKHNPKKITEVHLEVGKLTFLGLEQLKFAYQVLTQANILKGSKLVIKEKEPSIKCRACKYKGRLVYENSPEYHFSFPKFYCPKCGGEIEILEGRDCIIKKIVAES